MFIYIFFLFIKTISLFYSLFVFRISYKIIVLSSLNLAGHGLWAYPSLARGYGPETIIYIYMCVCAFNEQ